MTGAASVPLLASGHIKAYEILQAVSWLASIGAYITEPTWTNGAAAGFDTATREIVKMLGVFTTPFGRSTATVAETGSSIMSYLFYEASKNDPG